jgi:hypothetical protein
LCGQPRIFTYLPTACRFSQGILLPASFHLKHRGFPPSVCIVLRLDHRWQICSPVFLLPWLLPLLPPWLWLSLRRSCFLMKSCLRQLLPPQTKLRATPGRSSLLMVHVVVTPSTPALALALVTAVTHTASGEFSP